MAQMSEIDTRTSAENEEQQLQHFSKNDSQSTSSFNSFNDKEEIRRRLAFEIDDDDPIAQYKLSRKSRKSLSARMQNIDSLQICFLNENNESYTFEDLNNHSSVDNNNDIIMQNRIYYLFKKLQKEDFDLDKVCLFSDIEKPNDKAKFPEYHSKLYTEAKLALSQVKEICKLRIKLEKQHEQNLTPSIYDLIHNLPSDFQKDVSKFNRPILKRLRISELQLIVNDMFSKIENLNGSLVKMLIQRDELYMEQDSLLVDIEDLTKFLWVFSWCLSWTL